jgi:hypothetical protein
MKMREVAFAVSIVALVSLGCTKHKPASPEQVQQIREVYQTVDPNAKVGTVIAVLPKKGLAAVADIPLDQVAIGDTLVLMDSKQKIIGAGHVIEKTSDALQISYDVTAQGRQPRVGDLAVKANDKTK